VSENTNPTWFTKLMGLVNKVGNTILMNLTFLVSCIPVVTIGAAWSGLYGAVRYHIRGEGWFSGYKKGFKTRAWRNIIVGALVLFVGYSSLGGVLDYLKYILEPDNPYLVGDIIHLIINSVFLLAALLFSAASVPVNLYIPTDVGTWIRNTWYLVGHAPLQTLAVGILMWLPVLMFIFFTQLAVEIVMVFVAAYFAVCAWIMTILMKKPLIKLLKRQQELDPDFEDARIDEMYD